MNRVLSMLQRPFVRRSLAAVSAVLVFTACQPQSSTAAGALSGAVQAAPPGDAATPQAAPPGVQGRMMLPDFASLVQQHGPAVVNISTKGKRVPLRGRGLSPNDPMSEFFRRFGIPGLPGMPGGPDPRGAPQGPQGPQAPQGDDEGPSFRHPGGAGSGFIVANDGLVLTNAHVVKDAEEITVKLTDRREFKATLVGLDEATDVAVLRIDAKGLPTVRLGDPKTLRPGEWVFAIGSPFGFENSVTAGIVSSTGRGLGGQESRFVNFIQTDVAVNPGNSGGPLFNLDGEVVGINSQIYSRSGGYMGISFAIPIDLATDIKRQLVTNGRVARGRIGVAIGEVNSDIAEGFGLDRPRGALVNSVEPGSPAAKAGLREGDIILSANGRLIERSEELPTVIGLIRPGTDAPLEVWRERSTRRLSVRVGELDPPPPAVADGGKSAAPANVADRLGLVVRELTAEERARAAAGEAASGNLLVERAQGAAGESGIRRGDLILGVNGKRTRSLKEFRDAVAEAGKVVALLVQRGDQQMFVPVRPG
jgi:serine protease Do